MTEPTYTLNRCKCGHDPELHAVKPGTPLTLCRHAACGCLTYRPDRRSEKQRALDILVGAEIPAVPQIGGHIE